MKFSLPDFLLFVAKKSGKNVKNTGKVREFLREKSGNPVQNMQIRITKIY